MNIGALIAGIGLRGYHGEVWNPMGIALLMKHAARLTLYHPFRVLLLLFDILDWGSGWFRVGVWDLGFSIAVPGVENPNNQFCAH